MKTGDGVYPNSKYGTNLVTTLWNVLDTYQIAAMRRTTYNIPDSSPRSDVLHGQHARHRHARELKDAGVSVYVMPWARSSTRPSLEAIASSPERSMSHRPPRIAGDVREARQGIKLAWCSSKGRPARPPWYSAAARGDAPAFGGASCRDTSARRDAAQPHTANAHGSDAVIESGASLSA